MLRLLCSLLLCLTTLEFSFAESAHLSPRNTEVPFCFLHGSTRSWPFLTGTFPKASQLKFTVKQDDKILATGSSLTFSGLTVSMTPDHQLQISSDATASAINCSLLVELQLPDGTTERQQLSIRPAPPDRPISYLADFGDDLIRIFMDNHDGHWRPITKDAFDQYFRRCQAHGVSRLILWLSPFPYISDPKNYQTEHWQRYERQARAMLESEQLETLIHQLKLKGQSDPNWGLHVPWGWVRQLCALRLQRDLGPMITQSAAQHGIALTASFRPFESALTKYYEIPTFDHDGNYLWGFLPLATPTINYQPEATCFAHFRTVLEKMGKSDAGQLGALEFHDVQNAAEFKKHFDTQGNNLQIVATNFPPLQNDSLILQRQANGEFQMRPYGEIRTQAEANRSMLKDFKLEQHGQTLRITGLKFPSEYRYLVLSNPTRSEPTLDISTIDPVKLWAKAGNRLGRENIFWALDTTLDPSEQTKSAGIPSTGRDHTEFHATEASRKLLHSGPKRIPLNGHQLVIDLGAPWSVEMMDLNQPMMRENAIKEMATLLDLPAFDELLINTRSHVSLAASKADGEEGINTIAYYSRSGKKISTTLGIDRAYAPIAAAEDSTLQKLANNQKQVEQITTTQSGEWLGTCQSPESPFQWRYTRNRLVASGVQKLLHDLEKQFPQTRTQIVLPLPEQQVSAVRDGLEKITDANNKPYPRNYSRVWSTINHIPTIGEGMSMLQLDGLATEPILFGVRGLPDSAPLQLYLNHSFTDLATNRGSSYRGPRSFFFEAQESLRQKDQVSAQARRAEIICQLLNHPKEISEVILYEAADWLYYLPLSNPEVCEYQFLDECFPKLPKNNVD